MLISYKRAYTNIYIYYHLYHELGRRDVSDNENPPLANGPCFLPFDLCIFSLSSILPKKYKRVLSVLLKI